jgi:hypothetical protein
MRTALAALALLAFLPSAHAQDKAKGDWSHDGEFRLRDAWMMNGGGTTNTDTNTVMERFKLDLGFKPSEKLMANVTLMNNFNFGGGKIAQPDGTTTPNDYLTVNQAYATWMTSDDFNIKIGRMNYQIGDGSLMAVNDWEATPYAFEGVLGNYEAEFGRVQGFAFKHQEFGRVTNAGSGSVQNDAEQNAYGINFDLKTMPQILKMVNVHVIKDSSDNNNAAAGTSGVMGAQGKDYLRYGLNVALTFNIVDVKAWYEAYSGKDKVFTAGDVTKTDATGNMMQVEVAANLNNFMSSHVFVRYHQDSGDSNAADTKNEMYDPYFHEQHCSAGCMDLFDWGNLTNLTIGWTGKPTDATEVGLTYSMLSKTKKGTGTAVNLLTTHGQTAGGALPQPAADKSKLGDEIDLWATHKYTNGLSTSARLSYMSLGDGYTSQTPKFDKSPMEIFLEGRFTF